MTLELPGTGMACTMDIGMPGDIHPTNKQDVGKRLALCALARDYGFEELDYMGPHYAGFEVSGAELVLSFENGEGLNAGAGELENFQLAGEDRVFHPASARIEGEVVILSSEAVAEPIAARFCWGAADASSLFNAAGLPASSFRTDDWPIR